MNSKDLQSIKPISKFLLFLTKIIPSLPSDQQYTIFCPTNESLITFFDNHKNMKPSDITIFIKNHILPNSYTKDSFIQFMKEQKSFDISISNILNLPIYLSLFNGKLFIQNSSSTSQILSSNISIPISPFSSNTFYIIDQPII
jgi:hypothetical protein